MYRFEVCRKFNIGSCCKTIRCFGRNFFTVGIRPVYEFVALVCSSNKFNIGIQFILTCSGNRSECRIVSRSTYNETVGQFFVEYGNICRRCACHKCVCGIGADNFVVAFPVVEYKALVCGCSKSNFVTFYNLSFRRKRCESAFFIVYGNSNVQNLLEIHCERSILCRDEVQGCFRTFYFIESGKYVALAWCCRYSHFVTFDYLTFGTYCDCSRSLDSYIRRNVQNSLEYGCKRSVFCCRELQGRFIAFNVFVADKYITFACYGSYSHFVAFEYLTFGSYRNCSRVFNVGNSRYVQNLLEYGGERSIVRYRKFQCRFCGFNVFETNELVTFVSSDGYRCILAKVVDAVARYRAVFAYNHVYRVLDRFEVGNKSNIVGYVECIFWIVRNFVVANHPVNEVVTFVHCSRYRHFVTFEYFTFGIYRNGSCIIDVG